MSHILGFRVLLLWKMYALQKGHLSNVTQRETVPFSRMYCKTREIYSEVSNCFLDSRSKQSSSKEYHFLLVSISYRFIFLTYSFFTDTWRKRHRLLSHPLHDRIIVGVSSLLWSTRTLSPSSKLRVINLDYIVKGNTWGGNLSLYACHYPLHYVTI